MTAWVVQQHCLAHWGSAQGDSMTFLGCPILRLPLLSLHRLTPSVPPHAWHPRPIEHAFLSKCRCAPSARDPQHKPQTQHAMHSADDEATHSLRIPLAPLGVHGACAYERAARKGSANRRRCTLGSRFGGAEVVAEVTDGGMQDRL